jgi:23S rRNA (cytidine1920-2'-O)/16S rRNA (cytidine1409-2'-O)-methyltransferase
LRADARVVCIEGVNARSLTADDLVEHHSRALTLKLDAAEAEGTLQDHPELLAALDADFDPVFDFLTGDLSFISLTLVLPAVVRLLKPGGDLLMLVKPQFELQPGQVGKGGIVKDDAMYAIVEQRLRDCCAELGLMVTHWFDSAITGGDGNREFFICARKLES